MNPDVFITIVFAGFAVFAAVGGIAIAMHEKRRDDARTAQRGSRTESGKAPGDAAVH